MQFLSKKNLLKLNRKLDCVLQPVPQLDAHLQTVSRFKAEGFFEEIAHVLAEQAGLQKTAQLHAFISGAGGSGKSSLLKMIRDRIKLVLHSNQDKVLLFWLHRPELLLEI